MAMVAKHTMKKQVVLHLLDCAEIGGIWDEDLFHPSSKNFLQNLVVPFFCGAVLCEESDDLDHGIVLSAAQALDSDQYYAMVDSGTNAIIVPLHPEMQGDCRLSSPKCHSHWSHCSSL